MDASVLEATEALGEKKEKAMKAQEEKEEENLYRENVRTLPCFLLRVLKSVKFKMLGGNLSFGQKITLYREFRP